MLRTLVFLGVVGIIPLVTAKGLASRASMCDNNIDEDDCKNKLKTTFSENIYEMCCDDDMATNCCAFCKKMLTCDAENNVKREIIEMQMKYKYLAVGCSDTLQDGTCKSIQSDKFYGDSCQMCKEQVYGDICCSFCKKEVNQNWNTLMMDEIMQHPFAFVNQFMGFPIGGMFPGQGIFPGFGCASNNCSMRSYNRGYKNEKEKELGGTGNNLIAASDMYGQSPDDDIDDEKLIFLPTRNENGEPVCVNTIREDRCDKLSRRYHSGMVHKMCTEPHYRIVCCAYCRDQIRAEKMNRKKREAAFNRVGLYPIVQNTQCCDLISTATCQTILDAMYRGCAKRMCTSFHYGMTCCNFCKNICIDGTTPAPACENTLGDSGCKTILKSLFYGCKEKMCRPGYYSRKCCKMCEDAGYDIAGHGKGTGLGGFFGGMFGGMFDGFGF